MPRYATCKQVVERLAAIREPARQVRRQRLVRLDEFVAQLAVVRFAGTRRTSPAASARFCGGEAHASVGSRRYAGEAHVSRRSCLELVLVDDCGEDLGGEVVDRRRRRRRRRARLRLRCAARCRVAANVTELAAVGRLDHQARELVDRDAEVLDLFDVEAEPARDAGRR